MNQNNFQLNKDKAILIILFALSFILTSSGFSDTEMDINKVFDKYKKTLKQRYEDPIMQGIKQIEKEQQSWYYLKLRLRHLLQACQNLHDLVVTTTKTPDHKSIDYDNVVEKIDKLIDEYNYFMLYLKNTMTYVPRKSLAVLEQEELAESKKSYEEREFNKISGLAYQGTMVREFAARSLKTKIRRIVISSPYSKNVNRKIKFILQIGVKNPDRKAGQEELENLKAGYLYLDKKILKAKLKNHYQDIIDLFAHSSDNGKIMNNGIGARMIRLINGFIKNSKDGQGKLVLSVIDRKMQYLSKRLKFLSSRLESMKKRNKTAFVRAMTRSVGRIRLPTAKLQRKRFENTFGNNSDKSDNNDKKSNKSSTDSEKK